MKLLLTGRPGVGKTTVIRRTLEEIDLDAGGFYTEELREGGRRVGFVVRDLEGREGLLAHIGLDRGPRVGKYRVDVRSFEEVALEALRRALKEKSLVVVDEIGKMELFSEGFRKLVLEALRSDRHILGVIPVGRHPFIEEIKGLEGVEVWEVTPGNREEMPIRIASCLKAELR